MVLAVGGVCISIGSLRAGMLFLQSRVETALIKPVSALIEADNSPGFLATGRGAILHQNAAALKDLPVVDSLGADLPNRMRSVFANPSLRITALLDRARQNGSAYEDVINPIGHLRISVSQISVDQFWWRIGTATSSRKIPQPGVGGEPVPKLAISRSGAILFMNDAARGVIGFSAKALDQILPSGRFQDGAAVAISTKTGPQTMVAQINDMGFGRQEVHLLALSDTLKPTADWSGAELPVPLVKLTVEGKIVSANDMARKMLGRQASARTTLSDLVQGLGRPLRDWLQDVASGRAAKQTEVVQLKRPDRDSFVQITLHPLPNDREADLVAVLSDATELKTMEAQFVQSQKMQAIGQLAGGVAHDFNNLITAISGHCDLLLLRHDQGDQDYGDLVQINQNANRAAALVGQLLAFSRKQTLQPEVIDLRDTLSDLTHLLNRLVGERITLTLSHDLELAAIRADRRQLEQVLMNLVVNARDAMVDGGEIRIETEQVTLTEPLERDRAKVPPGDYVLLRVRDQGQGIDAAHVSKIFEPFFTTKRTGEGTGLGLSMVYGIVKQSGGYIFVDSAPGAGSAFVMYFPARHDHDAVPSSPVEKSKTNDAQTHNAVVLLVEDEASVRAFAARALQMRGHTVIEADSAEAALDILSDKDLNIDVVVTDVVMPGLDGPAWVREAQKTRPDIRVIFMSGYTEGIFDDNQPDFPNSVFLPKPFSLTQLTETVQRQLH